MVNWVETGPGLGPRRVGVRGQLAGGGPVTIADRDPATQPTAVPDAYLVAAALSNPAGFAAIYDRYADRLHDFCVGMLRDRDAAADCVQDTFTTAATRLAQLRERDKLRPWLYAIARHEALARLRARRREQPTDEFAEAQSGDPEPDVLAARSELARLVAQAAGGLAERDRTLLELAYHQGLEGPELADALGVSPSNANTMVGRLRTTVERSLGALLVARRRGRDCPSWQPCCRLGRSVHRAVAQAHRPPHRGLRRLRHHPPSHGHPEDAARRRADAGARPPGPPGPTLAHVGSRPARRCRGSRSSAVRRLVVVASAPASASAALARTPRRRRCGHSCGRCGRRAAGALCGHPRSPAGRGDRSKPTVDDHRHSGLSDCCHPRAPPGPRPAGHGHGGPAPGARSSRHRDGPRGNAAGGDGHRGCASGHGHRAPAATGDQRGHQDRHRGEEEARPDAE